MTVDDISKLATPECDAEEKRKIWRKSNTSMAELEVSWGIARSLERRLLAALDSLEALSSMYGHTWDREDGCLVMIGSAVQRFEEAHSNAMTTLSAIRRMKCVK